VPSGIIDSTVIFSQFLANVLRNDKFTQAEGTFRRERSCATSEKKTRFRISSSVIEQDKDAEAIERRYRHSNIQEANEKNSLASGRSI
jgi:hypothetical protein